MEVERQGSYRRYDILCLEYSETQAFVKEKNLIFGLHSRREGPAVVEISTIIAIFLCRNYRKNTLGL